EDGVEAGSVPCLDHCTGTAKGLLGVLPTHLDPESLAILQSDLELDWLAEVQRAETIAITQLPGDRLRIRRPPSELANLDGDRHALPIGPERCQDDLHVPEIPGSR